MANKPIDFTDLPHDIKEQSDDIGSFYIRLVDYVSLKGNANEDSVLNLYTGIGDTYPRLVQDMSIILRKIISSNGITSSQTVQTYRTHIVMFSLFLTSEKYPEQLRLKDITDEVLNSYRAWLIQAVDDGRMASSSARKTLQLICRIVSNSEFGKDIEIPIWPLDSSSKETIREYSERELIDLEDVCRKEIRSVVSRIRNGRTLSANGQDPRTRILENRIDLTNNSSKTDEADEAFKALQNLPEKNVTDYIFEHVKKLDLSSSIKLLEIPPASRSNKHNSLIKAAIIKKIDQEKSFKNFSSNSITEFLSSKKYLSKGSYKDWLCIFEMLVLNNIQYESIKDIDTRKIMLIIDFLGPDNKDELISKARHSSMDELKSEFGQTDKNDRKNEGWYRIENTLWFIENILNGRYLARSDKEAIPGLRQFNNVMNGGCRREYTHLGNRRGVYGYLYPTPEDLIPFLILILRRTGRNLSSILCLKRDCLLNEFEGSVKLQYRKERGSGRTFTKRIDSEGYFSTRNLIELVLELTEPLVKFQDPLKQDDLFIGLSVDATSSPIDTLEESYTLFSMNNELKGYRWCFSRNLKSDEGGFFKMSSRRMRVSYMSRRYVRAGSLAKISKDARHKRLDTTVNSYINKPELKKLHESSVITSINKIVGRATTFSSNVIGDKENEIMMSGDPHAPAVPNDRKDREKDVFFATCKDFYNDPNGEKNTPCKRPFGCINGKDGNGCSNAAFISRHLPRLVALDLYLLDQRKIMLKDDWEQSIGHIHTILGKHIFSKFSDRAMNEAKELANKQKFYMPMSPMELLR